MAHTFDCATLERSMAHRVASPSAHIIQRLGWKYGKATGSDGLGIWIGVYVHSSAEPCCCRSRCLCCCMLGQIETGGLTLGIFVEDG